jgi:hypothetical protein
VAPPALPVQNQRASSATIIALKNFKMVPLPSVDGPVVLPSPLSPDDMLAFAPRSFMGPEAQEPAQLDPTFGSGSVSLPARALSLASLPPAFQPQPQKKRPSRRKNCHYCGYARDNQGALLDCPHCENVYHRECFGRALDACTKCLGLCCCGTATECGEQPNKRIYQVSTFSAGSVSAGSVPPRNDLSPPQCSSLTSAWVSAARRARARRGSYARKRHGKVVRN